MPRGGASNRRGAVRIAAALLFCALASVLGVQSRADVEVDLALVLAIDCSYSVSDAEFHQQNEGLARAFRHPDVVAAIAGGRRGRIAVVVLQWSGALNQSVAVPWTIVDGEASALTLSNAIRSTGRQSSEGATSISKAIDAGTVLILRAPFKADRAVIDISGDGDNNNGGPPAPARDRAVAAGITINGLAILNDLFYLDRYYENHVIGGAGSFVMVAADYGAYADAIILKLLKEIEQPVS